VTVQATGESLDTTLPQKFPLFAVDIRNVSSKCVLAYSLATQFKDSEGKVIAVGRVMKFFPKNGESNCLDPGQTYNSHLNGSALDPSGNTPTAEATVDFVIFGDGSKWGPANNAEQKGYLLGRYDAYKQMQPQKNKQSCSAAAP
jgi:hypothetical protein